MPSPAFHRNAVRSKRLEKNLKDTSKSHKRFWQFWVFLPFPYWKGTDGNRSKLCHLERLKDQYEKSQVSSLFITSPALSILNIKTLSQQRLNCTKDKWFCKAIFSVSFCHLIVQLSWKHQFWTEKGKRLIWSFTSYVTRNCLPWSFLPSIEHWSLDSNLSRLTLS